MSNDNLIISYLKKQVDHMAKEKRDYLSRIEELENIAYKDQLTGLHNSNYLNYVLRPSIENKSLWIAYVDINNLKQANDSSPDAHTNGDRLIQKVANTISVFGQTIRVHGDEFLVLLENKKNKQDFEEVSEKDADYSYGITKKEKDQSLDDAISKADVLMYENKFEMKNNIANHISDNAEEAHVDESIQKTGEIFASIAEQLILMPKTSDLPPTQE